MIRPNLPQSTSFNKRTIAVLALAAGIIVFFALIMAFMPKATQKNGNGDTVLKDGAEPATSGFTPDEINNIPASYTGYHRPGPDQNKNVPPVPVIPAGDQSSGMPENAFSPNPGGRPLTDQELNDARRSPIRFMQPIASQLQQLQQQMSPASQDQSKQNQSGYGPDLAASFRNIQDPSGQEDKKAFFNSRKETRFYTGSELQAPLSKYEIKAGTVIPCTVITGINSDLPGMVTAQVRENVYDTVTGRFLLIPQGARLIGIYDSKIVYAQERLLVAWTRLILPNGKSISLEGMPGADTSGYAGFKDKVNNHFWRLVGAAALTSLFGAGAEMMSGNTQTQSSEDLALSGAAKNLAEAGTKVFEKNLNVQPSIEIRPGMQFNVFVDKDLILECYKG